MFAFVKPCGKTPNYRVSWIASRGLADLREMTKEGTLRTWKSGLYFTASSDFTVATPNLCTKHHSSSQSTILSVGSICNAANPGLVLDSFSWLSTQWLLNLFSSSRLMHYWEISDNSCIITATRGRFFPSPIAITPLKKRMVHVLRSFTSMELRNLHLSYAFFCCLGF